jgi:type II secretory pathway pseudopilin PulG
VTLPRQRHRPRAGFSVVEAIVATALAGIALAGLAAVAGLATASLRLARDTGSALALASERLESLRVGPRVDGDDGWTAPDGTRFTRHWTCGGGRGAPARLSASVTWGRHEIDLRTETLP